MSNRPIVTDRVDGYDITWGAEHIIISVTRLHQHISDGRVTGEILIKDDQGAIIYPQTTLNFNAAQSRTRLAKTLHDLDGAHEWLAIMNQLSLLVVNLARKGEPVQELWTNDNVPELEFLVEPIVIKGVPNVIFGEKGVAKSTLTLVLYICLILPWEDNPLGLTTPSRSIKTLILDYELPGAIAQRNAKRIQEGMNLPFFPLYHRRCSMPLASEIEQIANHIADIKAEVILIDSLARASGGELNKTEPATSFFEALDRLKVTTLITAQTSKDIETKRKSIFGSTLFTYYARNIFELRKDESLTENAIDVTLIHRYSNLTKLYNPIGLRLSYGPYTTEIQRGSANVVELMAKVNIKKAILKSLESRAMTAEEVAEALDIKKATIQVRLSDLLKLKKVVKLGDAKWGLVNENL